MNLIKQSVGLHPNVNVGRYRTVKLMFYELDYKLLGIPVQLERLLPWTNRVPSTARHPRWRA